jgi:hypothetical protein
MLGSVSAVELQGSAFAGWTSPAQFMYRTQYCRSWHSFVKQVVTSVPQDSQCLLLHGQATHLFFDWLTMDWRRAWAFKTKHWQNMVSQKSWISSSIAVRTSNLTTNIQHIPQTNYLSHYTWHSKPHNPPTTTDNIFISLFPDVLWLDTIFCYTRSFKALGHHKLSAGNLNVNLAYGVWWLCRADQSVCNSWLLIMVSVIWWWFCNSTFSRV